MTRRGSAYVLVLFATVFVVAAAAAGFELQRARHRDQALRAQQRQAASLARAALELAASLAAADNKFRTALPSSGPWIKDLRLGPGLVTITASDPIDGNLTSSEAHPVVLRAEATVGPARQIAQITLTPVFPPAPFAAGSMHAGSTISFSSATVTAAGLISSNANISAGTSTITGRVEAAGTVTGGLYRTSSAGARPARTLPDPKAIFDAFTPLATAIPIGNIPSRTIRRTLIGPGVNPFGNDNPQGIYLIDAGGNDLTIEDSRIIGTLIIRNASTVRLRNAITQDQILPAFPALLIEGALDAQLSGATLREITFLVNFNPPGSPHNGVSNLLAVGDQFPSAFHGWIYATGNANISGRFFCRGPLIVAGSVTASGDIRLDRDHHLTSNAPAPLRDAAAAQLMIQPGSFAPVVD